MRDQDIVQSTVVPRIHTRDSEALQQRSAYEVAGHLKDRFAGASADAAVGTDAVLELNARSLLNDVRGLVGSGVQIWAGRERNGIPRRVRLCADVARGGTSLAADMRLDAMDRGGMVRPKLAAMRSPCGKWPAGAAHASRGDLLRLGGVPALPPGHVASPLYERGQQLGHVRLPGVPDVGAASMDPPAGAAKCGSRLPTRSDDRCRVGDDARDTFAGDAAV